MLEIYRYEWVKQTISTSDWISIDIKCQKWAAEFVILINPFDAEAALV